MYILYSRATSSTGRLLRDVLGIQGGIDAPQAREDFLIRWGSSLRVPRRPARLLNSRSGVSAAADKLTSLETLRENFINVPTIYPIEHDIPLPLQEFPLLARRINHTQGRDIQLVMQRQDIELARQRGAEFLSKYIPVSREFRVHSFEGETIKISEKVLTSPEECTVPYIRNFENGYTFRNVQNLPGAIRDQVTRSSHAAVEALGLDFGAVDVVLGDDNQVTILEVNTGPSLRSDTSIEVYVNRFAEFLNVEPNRELLEQRLQELDE